MSVGECRADSPAWDVVAACKALSMGMRVVVARRGARGALVVGPDACFESPGFSVPVVDTTGSGDAFDGGFLAALCEGRGLAEAARWGNAAAAMNVSGVGARNVPKRQAFDRFLVIAGEAREGGWEQD